jgi:hypothetical protein
MEGLPSLETAPAAHDPWSEKRFSFSGIFTFMSILTLAAAVYVFHRNVGQGLIWLGEAMGGVEQRQTQSPTETPPRGPAKVSPAPATNMPTETPSVRPDSAAAQGAPTGNANQDENATAGKGSSVPAVSPPSGVSSVPGATASTSPSVEVGQAEYVRAMQLLGGRNGQVDMPEALRLLWIAVEKGNANAELELAEMYWRGRGVIQNCDQALILLTAATRKGSAEAQRRLQEFQKQGCE